MIENDVRKCFPTQPATPLFLASLKMGSMLDQAGVIPRAVEPFTTSRPCAGQQTINKQTELSPIQPYCLGLDSIGTRRSAVSPMTTTPIVLVKKDRHEKIDVTPADIGLRSYD